MSPPRSAFGAREATPAARQSRFRGVRLVKPAFDRES